MDTSTITFPFSGLMLSTMPLKFEKGPSVTRMFSPSEKVTFGLGLIRPSAICDLMSSTSDSGIGAGLFPPTKPFTFGVCRTRCQVRSSSSIWTRR